MTTQVENTNKDWIALQVNVFSRWVESQLKNHSDIQIETITKDLSNGVALVELAKILTHNDAPRNWVKSPKMSVQMVQNCDLAIDMFEKDGVHLVGISGKDVSDNNEKLILGLVWSLILHYSIGKSISSTTSISKENDTEKTIDTKNQTQILKSWAIERTENYPNIHNFTPYELSMCALLDSYVPEKINYYSLDPKDTDGNSKLASNVMGELGIPVLVTPDEVKNHDSQVDDKTLLTQLSTMKSALETISTTINNEVQERSGIVENDEKPDIESESENHEENSDNFDPVLFDEDLIDQESRIKVDFANESLSQSTFNDHSNSTTIEFNHSLYEEYEIEQETYIKSDFANESSSNENENEFDHVLFDDDLIEQESRIKNDFANESLQFGNENQSILPSNEFDNALIVDYLIEKEGQIKIDSVNESHSNVNNHYTKLNSKSVKKHSHTNSSDNLSFFDWFIEKVISSPESIYHQEADQPRYGWYHLSNTPIYANIYRYH